jgi:hypothetical protein
MSKQQRRREIEQHLDELAPDAEEIDLLRHVLLDDDEPPQGLHRQGYDRRRIHPFQNEREKWAYGSGHGSLEPGWEDEAVMDYNYPGWDDDDPLCTDDSL